MKTTFSILALAVAFAAGAAETPQTDAARKSELAVIVAQITTPNTNREDFEHSGLLDKQVQASLAEFIRKNADTEEAFSAEIWLSITQLETAQSRMDGSGKPIIQAAEQRLKTIAEKSKGGWQPKAAQLTRASCLLSAHNYEELKVVAGDVLANVSAYEKETAPDYVSVLKMAKLQPQQIEPTIRHMLLIGACQAGNNSDAIAQGELLISKFPEWSRWKKIPGIVTQLKAGKSPYPKI